MALVDGGGGLDAVAGGERSVWYANTCIYVVIVSNVIFSS